MGLFSGGKVSQPNPTSLIQQQAAANRVNQYTPSGSQVYGTVNPDGSFKANTKGQAASQIIQTPFQQQMQGTTEGIATGLAGALGGQVNNLQGMSLEGLPQAASSLDMSKIRGLPGSEDFSQDASRMEQATFDRISNLLAPQFEQGQRRLDSTLADRGMPISGEGFQRSQGTFADSKNRALTDAALQAVNAGRQEQQRLFGNTVTARGLETQDQLTNADLAMQGRQQGLGEQKTIRDQQLNELSSLLGGGYNPSPLSQFSGPGSVDTLGANQLSQNAQIANQTAQQQQQAAMLNGLFSLGGAGIGLL